MRCIQCLNEFKSDRSTAKFCSDKCRKLAFQKSEILSVPEKKETELRTLKPTEICHGCKEKQPSKFVCICHLCIGKEITHKSLGLEMCKV